MSEWCLRLPGVTYCVCGLFTQKKTQTRNTKV